MAHTTEQKIKTLQDGIDSAGTPKQFIPSMKERMKKLVAQLEQEQSADTEKKTKRDQMTITKKEKLSKAKADITKRKIKKPAKKRKINKGKFGNLPSKVRKFNKGVSKADLDRDAKRPSLPAGKRISKTGKKYTENRPDHADISKRFKLHKGGGVSERTTLSPEERQFIREESEESGQGYTYRTKILFGQQIILKEKDGRPIQKFYIDNYEIGKKISAALNKANQSTLKRSGGKFIYRGGGEIIGFKKIYFNSHKNHNPDTDIVVGRIDDDSEMTYHIGVKGKDKGIEGMEYYKGENYVVGSNKKSSSRNYPKDQIPEKYKKAWKILKNEYETKYKE